MIDAMRKNRSLRKLSFAYGREHVRDDEAAQLADVLAEIDMLTSLSLVACEIDVRGFEALAKALRTNTTLQRLDVSWNDTVTDDGVRAMVETLTADNHTLRKVTVAQCGVDTEVVDEMEQLLQRNERLCVQREADEAEARGRIKRAR